MPKFRHFASFIGANKVDRENGIIKGASLISIGEAKGHDCYADAVTLQQVLACAKTYTSGLRVMFNPDTFQHGPAGIAGVVPTSSMRIEGGKAVGDIVIPKNYAYREYLLDLAESQPDTFGLSIEFSGESEERDGTAFARCTEIYAATVVDMPAANKSGLFAVKDDTSPRNATTNTTTHMPLDDNDKKEIKSIFGDAFKAFAEGAASPLAISIGAAIKPVQLSITKLEEQQAQLAEDVEMAVGGDDDADGDGDKKEELAAAGVVKGDKPAEKMRKLRAFRATADKPVTRRDLLQFFRTVGNPPAAASAAADRADGGKGDDKKHPTKFHAIVEKAMEAGTFKNKSKAIKALAAEHKADFNEYNTKLNEGTVKAIL